MDNNQTTVALFLDLKRAFETVDRKILLSALVLEESKQNGLNRI
jgi:hypothetical protein